MAFQILRHAFYIIFHNFGAALKASVGPYLLLVLAGLGVFYATGLSSVDWATLEAGAGIPAADLSPLGLFLIFPLFIFGLFVFGWVAVAWHRYILLEEPIGVLPAVSGRPIWAYIGRAIGYGLLLLLVGIPVGFVATLIGIPLAQSGNFVVAAIPFLLVVVLMSYLWFRIAIALPSIAVGKPMRLDEAWGATSPLKGTIFGVTVLLIGFNFLAGIGVGLGGAILPVIGTLLDLFVNWLTLMLGVSILTTFYGHLVEKRPLIDQM